MATPEQRLQELGIELPEAKVFHPAVALGVITDGNMLYCSGSTPKSAEFKGRVGDALTVEQGYAAAKECAVAQLAIAKSVLGDLSRIKRVVKVLGMVNAAPGFGDTPAVIHGASELYYAVFGEKGQHARSAVGLQALPSEVAVEVETIFEIEPA
ncbi:MAG TPA: RidA family protein [Thermomicrobiales bacterium]|jgi:enamine deaminase RidA (YjgF/YER057c/UK114 family)|nr:RidA family protein [Thermomicrobiales bacterium]